MVVGEVDDIAPAEADVADLDDPRLVYKEVIGTRGSTSEATTNHLAFNYFGSRDLLAIPMTICEGSSSAAFSWRAAARCVGQRGWCLAAYDCRRLANERVVFERVDHEECEIDATGEIALENGVADVPAPHR